jgi:diguanylate cyclase (GGDEF)-like protein/PAS domain S-box-containing protein
MTSELAVETLNTLIIEDNLGDARLIRAVLEEEDEIAFELFHASRLGEGLALLEENLIDVVLLDLNLPDSKGMNTVRKLKPFSSQVPVVVLTGLEDHEIALEAVGEGAQDFIIKSQMEAGALVRSIRYSVERVRVEKALLESEERYRTLVEGSLQGLIIFQGDPARIVHASSTFAETLGYHLDTFLNLNPEEIEAIIHPEDRRSAIERYYARMRGEDVPPYHELRLIRKDGSIKWMATYTTSIEFNGEPADHVVLVDINERKIAEEKLRASEARYRAVAETAFTGISIVDPQERITYINPAFAEMLKYEPEELPGASLQQLVDSRGFERIQEQTKKREQGKRAQYELTMYCKDGDVREMLVSASPLFDIEGEFEGSLAVVVDITKRKHHERALRRTTQDLRLLSELNHEANRGASLRELVRDLSDGIQSNYSCQSATVYLMEEGHRLTMQGYTMSPKLRERIERQIGGAMPQVNIILEKSAIVRAVLEEGHAAVFSGPEENRRLIEDYIQSSTMPETGADLFGTLIPSLEDLDTIGSVALIPLLSEGEPVGILQLARDESFSDGDLERLETVAGQLAAIITQRRTTEELRYLKDFNESIVLSMAEGIVVEDADGVITFANPAACEMLGYAAEELVWNHWTAIIPEDQHAVVKGANRRRLEGKSDSYELKLRRKDGGQFDVLVSGTPLYERGQFFGTLAVFTDISSQKSTEASLEKRTREISLLYEAGRNLNRSLNLKQVYRTLFDLVADNLSCDGLFISSFDNEEELIRCEMAFHEGHELNADDFPPIPLEPEGQGTQSRVIRTGESILTVDFQQMVQTSQTMYTVGEEGIVEDAPEDGGEVTRSAMIVPMTLEDRVVGVIQCFSYQADAYTEDDLRILEALATHVAAASTNAALYQQAKYELNERQQAEKALKESEARLWGVVSTAPVIIFTLDKDGMFTLSEGRGLAALDLEPGEVVGQSVFDIYRESPEILKSVRRALKGEDISITVEEASLTFDTRYTPLRGEDGDVIGVLGVATDITERKRAEEQLRHDALHDSLTGLPNRSLFLDRLHHSLRRRERAEDYLFALLYLDLDRFKNVNDSLGHTRGDQLLIETARRLELCLRPSDTVARFGGDEFAVLLDGIRDVSDALRVAARIQLQLTSPFNLSGYEVFTSASIGIAYSATGYENVKDMLRDADIAMYRAKEKGKAQHVVFDQDMHDRAVARLELETDLRRAVENEAFQVHYQPIISVKSGTVQGLEALVRWEHPERGLVSPSEFIQLAEETGLIVSIDRLVIRTACRQLSLWNQERHDLPPLYISLNLSRRNLGRPDLLSEVDKILKETRIAPENMYLEITESGIMQDPTAAQSTLAELRGRGVQSLVDDFGTGHSSLSILQSLPIDGLKVDRSFIMDLEHKQENQEIVQTIIALAQNLGKHSIAEGVETSQQLEILRGMDCEFAQGYLFSKPLPVEQVPSVLDQPERALQVQPSL